MTIISFDYTSKSDEKTSRTVLVLEKPTLNYLTLDLEDMEGEELQEFKTRLAELETAQRIAKNELMLSYGVTKVRAFSPSRMVNIAEA